MVNTVSGRETGEKATPVPRAMLFANGSLTSFGEPKVSRFERKAADGTTQKVALYEKIPIFRSGVFADSMGYRKEWLPEQMHQMASNFDYLTRTGTFADVPVRVGHPSFLGGNPLKDVIGYFTSLDVEERESPIDGDENKYTYLLASYEILDPEADAKIQSGLYRNRSSEIGTFFTNDPETELWPVMMGVAYVDIPAVQGLNGFAKQNQTETFSIQMEAPVTGEPNKIEPPKPVLPATAEFTLNGTLRTTDFAKVQQHIADVEKARDEFSAQVQSLTSENTALKEFKAEQIKAGRDQRLVMLTMSRDGKPPVLTVPELEEERKFCAALDDATFEAYVKKMEDKGGNPLLGQHGYQATDEGYRSGTDTEDAKASEIATLESVIDGFRYSRSMTPERIKETSSFKRLVELNPAYTLPA